MFLAENPSETTNGKQSAYPFNVAHLLIIMLQFSGVTSSFDVYSLSLAEYENEDMPKIHLTAEEPSWDPSTSEYSDRKT